MADMIDKMILDSEDSDNSVSSEKAIEEKNIFKAKQTTKEEILSAEESDEAEDHFQASTAKMDRSSEEDKDCYYSSEDN